MPARPHGPNEAAGLTTELNDLINTVADDYATWHEVRRLIEQRRKLVESEMRRLVAMSQTMTGAQAMTLMGAVLAIIRRHVPSHEVQGRIGADMRALMDRPERHASATTDLRPGFKEDRCRENCAHP